MNDLTVTILLDDYRELLDLKTRVDVVAERAYYDKFIDIEDILLILGTDGAVSVAEKLRKEREERLKK